MSAGKGGEYAGEPVIDVISSLDVLAPGFRLRLEAGLADCREHGLDAIVHETYRSNATQAVYYARGRTTIPPHGTVTNARTNQFSWHGFALAADIISESKGWDAGNIWFQLMGAIFEKHGCMWGGRWSSPDLPHVQFGGMKNTPSDNARALFVKGGMQAVWAAVGASE